MEYAWASSRGRKTQEGPSLSENNQSRRQREGQEAIELKKSALRFQDYFSTCLLLQKWSLILICDNVEWAICSILFALMSLNRIFIDIKVVCCIDFFATQLLCVNITISELDMLLIVESFRLYGTTALYHHLYLNYLIISVSNHKSSFTCLNFTDRKILLFVCCRCSHMFGSREKQLPVLLIIC